MRSFPEFFDRTGHMSDDTTNDENGCRQGIAERKGALKVFLRALGDLRGSYFQNRKDTYPANTVYPQAAGQTPITSVKCVLFRRSSAHLSEVVGIYSIYKG